MLALDNVESMSVRDWVAVILFLLSFASMALLLYAGIKGRTLRRRAGWIVVVATNFTFWAHQLFLRLAYYYEGPSVIVTQLGIIRDALVVTTALSMSLAFFLDWREAKVGGNGKPE